MGPICLEHVPLIRPPIPIASQVTTTHRRKAASALAAPTASPNPFLLRREDSRGLYHRTAILSTLVFSAIPLAVTPPNLSHSTGRKPITSGFNTDNGNGCRRSACPEQPTAGCTDCIAASPSVLDRSRTTRG
jgi:hypothetical protein